MAVESVSQGGTVQLDWADAGGVITVTPRNQDRFTIKVRRAVEILRQSGQESAFREQFRLLLSSLVEWLKDNVGVNSAYVTIRDGALAFVVVREECAYNEEFEDSLSLLDENIAADPDLDLIQLNALTLPGVSDEALGTFLDLDFLVQVWPAKQTT